MSYRIGLSFEDGVTSFITCADGQTVADASYRNRINIPLDCRDGACGTCKAFCEYGEYDGGTYLEDALTADEAASGYVLPCCMKPKSDLVLQIASSSAVAKTEAATYTSTITRLDRLSPTTVSLAVETPDRDKLAFLPGQYVNIAVPGTDQTRSYSFSNGPDDKTLTFLVKLTPGGVMSEYLATQAKVGDALTFAGPNGSFFLRESARPVLLLAGGTGLAPILAILRSLRATGSQRPAHLVYGASTDDDVVELETLNDLAAQLGNFTWDYCVSAPTTAAVNRGYVTGFIADEHLHGGDLAVYLCGPPPMVEAVRTSFADRGVEPTGFYYEKFALSGTAPKAAEAPVVIVPEPEPVVVVEEPLVVALDSRSIAKQELFGPLDLAPLGAAAGGRLDADLTVGMIAGQAMWPSSGTPGWVDSGETALADADARGIAGQTTLFPEQLIAPLHEPEAEPSDGYEIGEEHPSIHESDAVFEAREALELGALELTIGRLTTQQIAGYRLLAESTLPYVDGDHFVDAAAYTETNAAFHDYLFTLTGNVHLLEAYRALGVTGRMEETLKDASWCHPRCALDHVDIVNAFEVGDRQAARRLIAEHSGRSKITMRRAMSDAERAHQPKFVTPGRFSGKVVVVTGAAQGIGERTARRISAEGGEVVLVDRSPFAADVAAELDKPGHRAMAVNADLETWDGARHAVEQALARFGRVDVLVNNVGGAIWFKPFVEFTPEQVQAEVTRSLMTTLLSCRAVLPDMVARGSGVIVNVSSVATRGIHRVPYSAAKGGVNALTASLALEVAEHGIRVVATAPGGTEAPPRRISRGGSELDTAQEQDWYQAHIDQTLASSPMHRYGTLDEQAAAIAFLASDEAGYITGTVLPVGGGDLG